MHTPKLTASPVPTALPPKQGSVLRGIENLQAMQCESLRPAAFSTQRSPHLHVPKTPAHPVTNAAPCTEAQADRIFAALDLDHSGYLTAAKLRHFLGALDIHMGDRVMSQMVLMHDLDGNGNIDRKEFYNLLSSPNFVLSTEQMYVAKKAHAARPTSEEQLSEKENEKIIHLRDLDSTTREALKGFDLTNSGTVNLEDIRRSAELFQKEARGGVLAQSPHEELQRLKTHNGLGSYISAVSHIALIVSDVGRSAEFYSKVLGFRQIRRPNFDEHGAWFTAGNIEVHLIKGIPIVHSGDDLIVGHMSLETEDIEKVPEILERLNVPYRQNVSVPSKADAGSLGTNTSNDNDKIVTQYFIRDPDGYYIEICNCEVLLNYCLGEDSDSFKVEDILETVDENTRKQTISLMRKWSKLAEKQVNERRSIVEKMAQTDGSHETIARELGCHSAKEIDAVIFENLKVRHTVYGDVCQNENLEGLRKALLLSGNNAEMATTILKLRAELTGAQSFQPPGFYEEGDFVLPPSFTMPVQ